MPDKSFIDLKEYKVLKNLKVYVNKRTGQPSIVAPKKKMGEVPKSVCIFWK